MEAARDSNCLHLHKSIDLPDLLGCRAVSIHLWMHAYSKLQCPRAELWVANRSIRVYVCVCVSLSLAPFPLSRSHLLPISSHPFHGRAEGCTTATGVTSTLVTALYWIVNDTPPPSLLLLPCLALPKNVSITKNVPRLSKSWQYGNATRKLYDGTDCMIRRDASIRNCSATATIQK